MSTPEPDNIEGLVGRFRKTYVFALGLLALLLVSLAVVSQYDLQQQTKDAMLINISGRQRMLSQRLVKEVLLEKELSDILKEKKARLIGKRLQTTHRQLEAYVHTSQARAIYDRLTPLVATLTDAAERTEPDTLREKLPALLHAESGFLPLMDQLVGVFESEARARVGRQRALQLAILLFLLLVLLLEGFYIFAPMVRSLSDTLRKLQLANRETRLALEKSETAERLKSRFLTSVSHELKTPMNGILGTSDLLMDCSLTTQAADYVSVIQQSAEHLLAIVNDILDISKLESGDLRLLSKPFSLEQLLEESAEQYRTKAGAKGLIFDCEISRDLPQLVEGDAGRVGQILDNLLSNAVKYTDQGQVRLAVSAVTGGVRFEIADSGPGIPEDRLKEMLMPFRQLDEGATRKYQGVGLGLPIVDKLVQLHGEKLEIKSLVGQGTTFGYRLPLKTLAANLPSLGMAGSESRIMDHIGFRFLGRVLVVEDNETNQMVCQRMLGKSGLEVDVASHGEEALQLLTTHTYDLIFMDLQMPVMDGASTAERIRQTDQTTPIVALTANASSKDREECLKAGMNGFLTKPLRARALRDLLLEHLQFELTESKEQANEPEEPQKKPS